MSYSAYRNGNPLADDSEFFETALVLVRYDMFEMLDRDEAGSYAWWILQSGFDVWSLDGEYFVVTEFLELEGAVELLFNPNAT